METYHPWLLKPAYKNVQQLPLAARLAELRKPDVQRAVLTEQNDIHGVSMGSSDFTIAHVEHNYEQLYPLRSDSTYEPRREESFAGLAEACNRTPAALLYEYLTAEPGRMVVYFFTNYSEFNLDAVRDMQMDDATVTGLSDAGAHVSLIFDAVNPTYQLTYWTRDRTRGERLPLPHVIHRGTRRNAELFGFNDRGLIAPGMRADLNVIDYANLRLGDLTLQHDLPAGGRRLLQGAQGYLATLINGEITRRFDEDTGARPGRLIRS